MAVLNPKACAPSRPRVVIALLAVTFAGCMVFDRFGGGAQPLRFSHRVHAGDEAIDCADCHLGAESDEEPGMPVLAQCQLCHKNLDAEKPEERRVTALFGDGKFLAQHAARLPDEVIFSHRKHVASIDDCAQCHAGILTNESIDDSISVTKDACSTCHQQHDVAGDCATCHQVIRRDWQPESHDHAWLRLHGKAYRAQGEAIADRCDMCHRQATCNSCHQDVPPASHNQFFRLRGHGLHARMDRESCAACHRADSCNRCHSQVLPQNHHGAFGGTRSTHCLNCHLPLSSSDCITCHKGTPSHALATPMPPGHLPGMNCRQCHGLTAPLPHVDNGSACTACHR
jgi:hypothetical protein